MTHPMIHVELGTFDDILKAAIIEALRLYNGNITASALHLKVARRSLYNWIQEFHIPVERDPCAGKIRAPGFSDEECIALAHAFDRPESPAKRIRLKHVAQKRKIRPFQAMDAVRRGRWLIAQAAQAHLEKSPEALGAATRESP